MLLLAFTGCTEPCIELTTRLCKCEASEAEQQACTQAKKNEANQRNTTNAEQEICEGYLDKAECQEETICENDNVRACGLSNPGGEVSE